MSASRASTDARIALALVTATLLAGCQLPARPAEPIDEPARDPTACALLLIASERATIVRGTPTTLALRLENCGSEPLPLTRPGRCSGGGSMTLNLEGARGTYALHAEVENGTPERTDGWISFGPCPTTSLKSLPNEPNAVNGQLVLPAILSSIAPGEGRTEEFRWNGSVREMLLVSTRSATSTGTTGSFRLLWAPAGNYTLTAGYSAHGLNGTVSATPVHVELVEARSPDPDLHPGYTLWTPALPPIDASPPPANDFFPGGWSPGTWLPENVEAAANESHARWLGENVTRERLVLTNWSYTPDCRLSTGVCDRWGWTSYYILEYEMRFPEIGETWTLAPLPVRTDGLVVEDEMWGYPDCERIPAECAFPIDETEAIALAQSAGLGQTDPPIEATFTYAFQNAYPDDFVADVHAGAAVDIYGTFAWSVRNHTNANEGESFRIDANDGRVLRAHDRWARVTFP